MQTHNQNGNPHKIEKTFDSIIGAEVLIIVIIISKSENVEENLGQQHAVA
jgi:hypothetical protein